jgi:hypothetical protein
MPIPDAGPAASRIGVLAGRLSCSDDRYANLAERLGVDHGPVAEDVRADMEAEIDALVARAYGLTADDLRVMFRDFVDAALPDAHPAEVCCRP